MKTIAESKQAVLCVDDSGGVLTNTIHFATIKERGQDCETSACRDFCEWGECWNLLCGARFYYQTWSVMPLTADELEEELKEGKKICKSCRRIEG